MKFIASLSVFFVLLVLSTQSRSQQFKRSENVLASHLSLLPDSVFSGKQSKFHVQGVALDQSRGFIYFSFTDRLVKMDLQGRLIGSVTGFAGHLGDLDFNSSDGKIYGSLEYKDDAIGKGISKALGRERQQQNGFYVAVFDCSRIVRPDMNAEKEDLLRTVYIKEAVTDYEAMGAGAKPHRFGCSGIDGIAFAPAIGSRDTTKKYLYVAYGVYGDTDRSDNDHQVLLKYDIAGWDKYRQQLIQDQLHQSGPEKPQAKYFVHTGSTRYGIQNLAWDPHTGNFFAAVYKGAKPQFPNYDLFVIDAQQKPGKTHIGSGEQEIKVETLNMVKGWNFKWGSTGLCPLGGGLFYISHNQKDKAGLEQSTVFKYKWIGDMQNPFVRVE